jgi:hypothetical protein
MFEELELGCCRKNEEKESTEEVGDVHFGLSKSSQLMIFKNGVDLRQVVQTYSRDSGFPENSANN